MTMVVLAILDITTTQIGLRSGLAYEANPVLAPFIMSVYTNIFKVLVSLFTARSIAFKLSNIKDNISGYEAQDVFPDIQRKYKKSLRMANRTKVITVSMMIFVVCWNITVIALESYFRYLGI